MFSWARSRAPQSVAAEAVGRGFAFLFFAVVARACGPAVFADVRYVTAAGLLGATLGIPFLVAFSRDTARISPDHADTPLSAPTLRFDLTGWALTSALGAVAIALLLSRNLEMRLLLFISVLGAACNYYLLVVARSLSWLGTLLWAMFLGNAGQLLVLLLLLLASPSVVDRAMVVAVYCVGFVGPVVLVPKLRRSLAVPVEAWHVFGETAWRRRGELASLGLLQAAHTCVTNLDLVILGLVATRTTVASYAVAKSLGAFVLLPVNSLYYLVLPEVSRAPGGVTPRARRLLWGGTLLTFAAAIALAVAAGVIVPMVYGKAYPEAVVPTALVAIASGLYGVTLLHSATWVGRGATRAYALLAATAAFVEAVIIAFVPGTHHPTQAASVTLAVLAALAAAVLLGDRFVGLQPAAEQESERTEQVSGAGN